MAEDEPQSFIFMSEDALKNTDRLLILIHGSGVVRAGQWARRYVSYLYMVVELSEPDSGPAGMCHTYTW